MLYLQADPENIHILGEVLWPVTFLEHCIQNERLAQTKAERPTGKLPQRQYSQTLALVFLVKTTKHIYMLQTSVLHSNNLKKNPFMKFSHKRKK